MEGWQHTTRSAASCSTSVPERRLKQTQLERSFESESVTSSQGSSLESTYLTLPAVVVSRMAMLLVLPSV